MKFYLITGRIPESEESPAHDNRVEIGETNPFDTSGKPFTITYHPTMGIASIADWTRLLHIYGDRITQEFIVHPDGLRQASGIINRLSGDDLVPAHHLISLLNDGFSKGPIENGKIVYFKQKGRIEDDNGKTYTPDEMIKIMESK